MQCCGTRRRTHPGRSAATPRALQRPSPGQQQRAAVATGRHQHGARGVLSNVNRHGRRSWLSFVDGFSMHHNLRLPAVRNGHERRLNGWAGRPKSRSTSRIRGHREESVFAAYMNLFDAGSVQQPELGRAGNAARCCARTVRRIPGRLTSDITVPAGVYETGGALAVDFGNNNCTRRLPLWAASPRPTLVVVGGRGFAALI
jgi:hypothetical protein